MKMNLWWCFWILFSLNLFQVTNNQIQPYFRRKTYDINNSNLNPWRSDILRVAEQDGARVLHPGDSVPDRRNRGVVVADEGQEIRSYSALLHEEFVL